MIKQANGYNIILFERKDEYDYQTFIEKQISEYLNEKTLSNFLCVDINISEPNTILKFIMNSLQGSNINKILVINCNELKQLECKIGTAKEYKGKIPILFDEMIKYMQQYKKVRVLLTCTNISKVSKIYKKIEENGKVLLCERTTLRTYITFVKNQISLYGLTMDNDTIKYFLTVVDNNKSIIDNELKKLSLLDLDIITKRNIDENVIHSKKYIVFELIKNIGCAKFNKSISLVKVLFEQGASLIQIIVLLQRNYRILFYIKCRADLTMFNINKYSIKNYDEQIKLYNIDEIVSILNTLLIYESFAKKSQMDELFLIHMLIFEIIN